MVKLLKIDRSQKLSSLIVGLSFLLILGSNPVFGIDGATPSSPGPGIVAQTESDDPIVFESSSPDFSVEVGWRFDNFVPADDFILDKETMVTDFHFILHLPENFVPPLNYTIWADSAGTPGANIHSGIAQNIEIMPIPDTDLAEVWFDFDSPFLAQPGVTYWIGMFCASCDVVGWQLGVDNGFGNNLHQFTGIDWEEREPASWFALSAKQDPVAGEISSLDTSSLVIAWISSSTILIIPALAALVGTGIYLAKLRKN